MELVKLEGYDNVYMVDCFMKEYKKLFGKNKMLYEQYLKKLKASLSILEREKDKASIDSQHFEKLQGNPFYAIRHKGMINSRVIYAYVSDDGIIILLYPFQEKKTKDYTNAICIAESRMKALEGI